MTVLSRLKLLPQRAWRPLRGALIWMLLAAVLDGLAGLALVPLLLAWFDASTGGWLQPLGVLLGLTALQALVGHGAQRRGYLAGAGLAAGLVSRLLEHLPRLPLGRQRHLEGLVRGPVFGSMGIPAHLLAPLITALVTPTVVVLGLFAFAPRLALLLALAYLPLFGLLRWAGRRSLDLEQQRQAVDRQAGQLLQAFAEQQALLRSSADSGQGQVALREALRRQHETTRALNRRALPASLGFATAVQLVFSAMLGGGVMAVAAQQLPGALLVAVLVLLVRFIEPLSQLAQLDQALRMAWQALSQVLQVLATPTLHSPHPGAQPRDASLAGQGLNSYGEHGEQLLEDLDLHCAPGSFTAIVGPSGAGKSTLLALLGRGMDPQAGVVRLGQVDIRQLSESTLAAHLTQVFQDGGLFAGSLAWNVAMACPDATPAQLQQAAEAAALDEVIDSLERGWHSEVGPGGGLLSGGQRQRVGLARALLSTAPIVLLDEPTASLDARRAARVNRSLRALQGRRTLVLVSHDPDLVRDAEQILVLESGRITGRGSHEQLLATHPWYAQFTVQ
ncbi:MULTISPECIES: ABC transporter ATP-binding protein [unclassified Pseudomonas]|uniref:ABC transporter ATP-binding protein n=1 Tax=unclassified Pseudomonas TaxID=196821 RepID=UPI0024496BA7|nr:MULTISPECIES: ABC transporter ATP-binding protein [unclassified Pseudomonas]MDH0303286.1 ABC transporter ATP-binding protein/permease [Pseudomonas sp. GD04091]MDH1985310.1 ABC transporter ATP-binding protein/permease [Pseudomonas sp. GD03689]